MATGTHSVTEIDPAPFKDLTELTCVDQDSCSSDLDPGETVTCTFTNTEQGPAAE